MIANADTAIVGREQPLAALWRAIESAFAGRLAVILVNGEPGIGKSRLLDAAASRAAQVGAEVLRGSASEAEAMPPYLPFLEALGQHIRLRPADNLRQQIGADAAVLATILPELATRLGNPPASYPLPPEQARMRLYEAVGGFLRAIAAEQPLLVVLDDLQWADSSTLDLLCYVARHQPDARLAILGAYRAGDVDQNLAFGRALAELNRLRVLQTIVLGPLNLDDTAKLASEHLGSSLSPVVQRILYDHSEGNPFFAEELLRGWQEAGALVRAPATDSEALYSFASATSLTVPESIVAAVGQRLARLPTEVIELLRAAAVVGRDFEAGLLADVVGQNPDNIEDRLRLATRALLIRDMQGGRYRFAHDKVRECLAGELTSLRRQRLHGFIGRALEARADATGEPHLADLAFHFGRSGDRERALVYARRAAEASIRAYAPAEAQPHYRLALELASRHDRRRGELLVGLGEAALLAGAEGEAANAFAEAEQWFQSASDVLAAGRAAHRLGQAWMRQEEVVKAREAYESARRTFEHDPGADLARVLVDLGTLAAVSQHQLAEGIDLSQRALALAQQLEDRQLQAAASRSLGNLLVRSNDLRRGIPLLEQAFALAASLDDPVEAAECCAYLAPAYFWNGEFRRSEEVTLQRLGYAQRCHDPYQLRHVDLWLSVLDGLRGRTATASRRLDQAQVTIERLASPEPGAFLQFCRGALAYERGDYGESEELLQQALAIFRAMGPGAVVWYLGIIAAVQLAAGKEAAAKATAEELEGLLATVPTDTMVGAEPLTYLTLVALRLDDQPRLGQYYARLRPYGGQFHDALVDRLLGAIATRRGDWSEARERLATAEATARREDLRWELGFVLEARADLLLAQGGRERIADARGILEESRDLFQSIGSNGEARRLETRLQALVRRPSARAPLPFGLSPREAEVLRLVAAGKRNRDIAEALVVSEKTVENHLASIFAKTGADNRATATALAIRNGLT